MNRLIHLTLVLFLAFACGKKKADPGPANWGNISATLNGQLWQYSGWTTKIAGRAVQFTSASQCEEIDLSITVFNKEGFLRQSLNFTSLPRIAKTSGLSPTLEPCRTDSVGTLFLTKSDDGDVGQDYYQLLAKENNYLQITSFDTNSEEIKGVFSVTFVIQSRSSDPSGLPDTLRFTNANFHTKVVRR